ncbi:MAG: lysophospholipid acyltransferase family protein, partial [Rickettsiales bacterium]|jgi:KDO2-lipid IV(A) lauroyltransferase|nr:lysophospholipid acyltransferase family protein [Rickettsiales bacterium]
MSLLSFIFANLAVLLSPFMPRTYLILRNLKNAMPKLSYRSRIVLMFRIWYNLGRFAGEYPYIYKLKDQEIFKYADMSENLKKTLDELKNSAGGSIIFSGHLSNWEIGLRALRDYGLKVSVVFRKLNNPLLEPKYTRDMRQKIGINMIAKQDGAAFGIAKSLRRGETVVILTDQRDEMNGLLLDFFGQKAYTPRSIYVLAKKMKVPVYGMRVIRKHRMLSKFYLDVSSKTYVTDNLEEEEFLTEHINRILEKWIEEYPEQWFWIHDRWKI